MHYIYKYIICTNVLGLSLGKIYRREQNTEGEQCGGGVETTYIYWGGVILGFGVF